MAILSLVLALVGAFACWYGNWRTSSPDAATAGPSSVEWLQRGGKLLVPLALIGWVLASGGFDRSGGHWLLVGLVFALIGDIALIRTNSPAFLTGLGAFALAQVALISAFVAAIGDYGFVWWMALIGLLFAGLFVGTAGRRTFVGATAKEGPPLGYGVLGYMALLTASATAAGGSGRWLALSGAMLFVISDSVLALDRFVGPRTRAGLFVMTTYHLALAGLTFGIAA